jgi:hydrogenase-4 component B
LAILSIAALSAVLGVLYALVESDLKSLLAYSTIENVGIILLGVGAAMLFQNHNANALAALALTAALFHTLNHTLFKSLLFMGAGAVLHATHTRNMEAMGGLIKRMPQTAALFLVGSVAIAALPPLNGFAGEWLTFQALLLSFRIPAEGLNLVFALAIAALALTGGLAAACFVKAFGIPFLALPRSEAAEHAHEVDGFMRGAMLLPAVACIALGIAPGGALAIVEPLTFGLTGAHADLTFDLSTLAAGGQFATLSPPGIALGLALLLVIVPLCLWLARANRTRRTYETWGCGRAVQTARFEYTATAFSNPFKRVFGLLYRPVKALDIGFHPGSRFFIETIKYSNETRSIIDDALYAPLGRLMNRLAAQARRVQSGNVHSYLLYILVALVVLLVMTR